MAEVVIYSSDWCPYCRRAKQLLVSKGASFDEIRVDNRPDLRAEMIARSGRNTVPQIWINQRHIGGCDNLHALEHKGELDKLLAG